MKRKLVSVLVVLMFFSFTLSSAAAFTPPGLAKKGGLPPGIQKRFSNELWQNKFWDYEKWEDLMDELEDLWDEDEWEDLIKELKERFRYEVINKEYKTTLEEIDLGNKRIMIKDGTAHLYLLVADNAKIQLNGKSVRLSSLSKGNEVYLKLNKDNTVTEIIVIEDSKKDKETKVIKGASVESINYETRRVILNHNNTRTRYTVNSDATITANNSRKNLNYIEAGMKVDATIKDGNIIKIDVVEKIEEYEGKLVNKYSNNSGTYILIEIDDMPVFFYIDKDLSIPSRLIGEKVYIEVKDNVVIDIWRK